MSLATATITYDISDLVGVDFDARRTKIWVTTNIADNTIVDTDAALIRVGDGLGTIADDGTGSVQVWVPGDSNPETWQTYLHLDYAERRPGAARVQRTFGPFTVTEDTDLAYLIPEQEVPPTYLSTITSELQTYVDEAQAARDEAAISAESAAEISGLTGEDEAVALLVSDDGTETGVAVSSAVISGVDDRRGDRLAPLARINKAATGPYRVLGVGTSISNNTNSIIKVAVEELKARYGAADSTIIRCGLLGGSYTAAYSGWKKQPFGGLSLDRIRGDSTSSDLELFGYGDQVVVHYSKDSGGGSFTVKDEDGDTLGTIDCSGTQAYNQTVTYALDELGPHKVVLNPPATGYGYVEYVEIRDSNRRGVEYIDGTYGGSYLGQMVNVASPTGAQVAGVAIGANKGVDSVFTRTDVDAFYVSYVVNDAGRGMTEFLANYKPAMDRAVADTAATGTPLTLMIEMAGHYSLTGNPNKATFDAIREYLLTLQQYRHVTVIDWHAATIRANKIDYAAAYYPTATSVNDAAGTYAGDFIHPNDPGQDVGRAMFLRAANVPKALAGGDEFTARESRARLASASKDAVATLAGVSTRMVSPAGGALELQSYTDGGWQGRQVPYYRAPLTNLTDAATLQGLIDASGTSTAYGKYYATSLYNLALGNTPDWSAGAKRQLTFRASGTVVIRAGQGARLYANGFLMPFTDSATSRTQVTYTVTGAEPVTFSARIGGTANNGVISISGNIYEIALVDSDVPTLIGAGGPTGPAGPTGAAGGFGSALMSGSWSSPTVGGAITTVTPTLNDMLLLPFVPIVNGNIDMIGIEVTTAGSAGAVWRFGLYSSDANGRPTTRLVDAGTIDATSTGWKKTSAFTAVPIVAGSRYWIGAVPQVATSAVRALYAPASPLVLTLDAAVTQEVYGYRFGGQTGALVNPVNFWGTFAVTNAPLVRVRGA